MTVPPDFRPDPDEPAVRHPQLRTLVDAARAQPAPRVGVEPEALHTAWKKHRDRRRWIAGAGLAVAASVALWMGPLDTRDEGRSASAPASGSDEVAQLVPRETSPLEEPASHVEPSVTPDPPLASPRLAAGVDVSPLGEGHDPIEILGPHRLRLPQGRWSIDSSNSQSVEVALPGETLQLRGGHVHVEVAGTVAKVEVLREQVVRIDSEGRVVSTQGPASGPAERPVANAESLAQAAEAHLAAGRRAQAIKSLRRLVTRFPRSAAAQAGLIDLGGLLEREARTDEARCAYALFLSRWPGHALRHDIAAAHRALGQGPGCRGLRPGR